MKRPRIQGDTGTAEPAIGPHSFERSGGSPTPAPGTRVDLHICPECASPLVFPIDWEPVGKVAWKVALRCPECQWNGGGVYSQDLVDRFDEVLDDGTTQLIEDLRLLARANMEDDVERLIAALHAGAILPEDF